MSFHDEDHVITMEGVVIWEAITKPDVPDNDPTAKNYNLRIAVMPNAPEIAELEQLVTKALHAQIKGGQGGCFNGVMPHGGNHPISPIDAAKFPELPGRVCFTAGTRLGVPTIVNANGAELQPMQYGPLLYNGTKVKLLVHAYPYNNKQKGVNFGLDGVQIVDGNPATAPRLAIGASGLSAAQVKSAFGGPGASTPAPATPAANQPAGQVQPYTAYTDAPPVPGDDAPPPPPVAWPPEGWKPNPTNPAWWYNSATKEQIKEADLRARVGA